MTSRACHYGCGRTSDLRPYGPGGAWVCFDCATATPDREEAAAAEYVAQLEAVAASGAVVVIGEECGPRPLRAKGDA